MKGEPAPISCTLTSMYVLLHAHMYTYMHMYTQMLKEIKLNVYIKLLKTKHSWCIYKSVIKYLHSMHEVLGSSLSTTKNTQMNS